MTATPSQLHARRTLELLLAEQGPLAVPQAVELVRNLGNQVAAAHAASRIHGNIAADAVLVDDELTPALIRMDSGSVVALVNGEWLAMLPEMQRLSPLELPGDIAAARGRLQAAGIALDPRQIDIAQLGALLCRLLTAESPAAYLRSARVKGRVPAELRPVLERALGCDGQERFTDVGQLLAALDRMMTPPTAVAEGAPPDTASADASSAVVALPSRPTGDTTPSFVASVDNPADTSLWPEKEPAAVADRDAGEPQSPLPFEKLGHYEIVARIGRGGMGDVYRGYERSLDREVAIKVLPYELARSDEFVRRFRTEATAVAKLNHPNIVPIHFIGEDQGHHFYAMQFVEGESLADLLVRRPRLTVDETLPIVEQALAGLAAAHEHGMVHRDIKPGNILLDHRSRRALLADFGLVKSLESSATGKTATGVIMGTVDYISPEQGRGLAVDGRSDLYSIGVLLYRMLSGRLPFTGDSPTALIFQHVYEPPPALSGIASDVPAPLAAVVAQLLAKSPGDRHQTAEEVLTDLRCFRSGQPMSPRAVVQANRQTKTTIIRPPAVDEPVPFLPEGLAELAPLKWWEATRDRAVSLFRRHAPEVLQQLQDTQQQVEGAVATYERRRREFQQLADDAQSLLEELERQASEQRAAALAARERAATAEDPEVRSQAEIEQETCERAAAGLDRQIADQHGQLEPIGLQLAQARARVGELKNQRDILQARLKAARAERYLATGGRDPSERTFTRTVLRVALVVCFGLAVFAMVRSLTTPGRSTDTANQTAKEILSANAPESNLPNASSPSGITSQPPLVAPATNFGPKQEKAGIEKQLALSRDGTRLALAVHTPAERLGSKAAGQDQDEIKLWNLTTREAVLSFDDPHHSLRMAVSPDGSRLISLGSIPGSDRCEFKVWEMSTGKVRQHKAAVFPTEDPAVGFSSDGNSVVMLVGDLARGGAQRQDFGIVNVETGRLEEVRMPIDKEQAVRAAFSPVADIAAIGIGYGRNAVDIYKLQDRKAFHSIPGNFVNLMQFSGDGRFLVGFVVGKLIVWETENWTQVDSLPTATQVPPRRIAVSVDGRHVAGLLNRKVEIYDVKAKTSVVLGVSACLDLAFTPGGTLIVAPQDLRFAFFDPQTGDEQSTPVLRPSS